MYIGNKVYFYIVMLIFCFANVCYANFEISPINFYLDRNFKVTSLTIKNNSDEKKYMQADVLKWKHINNQDVYLETQDLLIVPQVFEMDAGKYQVIRIAREVDDFSDDESAYRVRLREISNSKNLHNQVNFTFNFMLPLFIEPKNKMPMHTGLAIKRNRNSISVANSLNRHVKILSISQTKDGKETTEQMVSYLFPAETKVLNYKNEKADVLYLSLDDSGDIQKLKVD